ncbi:MAG: universal stress protein [Phycisphaerae bacterium]|nr:universal stress protein [Phycisphaerae bacterium]
MHNWQYYSSYRSRAGWDALCWEDLDSHVHFLLDEPEIAIPELAARQHIELIVMGTVCRTGLPGLFIGSTAENVLSQVDCSVLALKPEGFVSPVKQKDM